MWRSKIYLITLLIALGCIDKIEVDTSTEPERLVVDGFITNKPGEYTIKLSTTVKFSNEYNTPVSNAVVKLISASGEIEEFKETITGTYVSCPDYYAKTGEVYKLQIEVDGKVIESTEQMLPDQTNFENLKYVPDRKRFFREVDNAVISEPGVTIKTYLPPTDQKRFYLWDLEATFIFDATRARSDDIERCWVTNRTDFQDIYIHEDLEGGYEKDIAFIIASDNMSIDYSLLVKQYNISEEAYTFWNFIKKQKENSGSIFDTPPFSIGGNMSNVQDSKDIILGYFGVYNSQGARIKWILEDLPFDLYISDRCESIFRGRPLECLDCRRFPGGTATTQQPDWWE